MMTRLLKILPLCSITLVITAVAHAQPVVSGVANAESYQVSLAPGTLATVFGSDLATSGSPNPTVTVAGLPCYVIFASSSQLNIELPVTAPVGATNLTVDNNGVTSSPFSITLNSYAPALATSNGSGSGLGLFTDGANTVSSSSPAHIGDAVASYGVGLGATNPVVPTGVAAPTNTLVYTVVSASVTVGGVPATVTFSGLEPGFIGAYQVNFTIPTNVPIGNQNVTWTIGGVTSPSVTIPIAAGNPASLTITGGSPQTASINTQFAALLSVMVTDAESNPVTGATVTFAGPSVGPGATFANNIGTAITNSSGIATIAAFANSAIGSFNVTASVTGVSANASFSLTNQTPSSTPYLLQISASPSGAGSVPPVSGESFPSGAIVQVSTTETSGYTFTGWTGAVADPDAYTTTVAMSSSQTLTANFIPEVFTDVTPSDYYFDAVNLLSQLGITSGCASEMYCPTEDVTRAQMAVFIVRGIEGSNSYTIPANQIFSDVPPSAFGYEEIQEMYALGITTGCGPGTDGLLLYCPTSSVTRAQMAVFIIRARYGSATQFDYPSTPYFTDVPANAFGFGWIQRMREDNITTGCGPTTYCPTNPVTRGDMAIFIMRSLFNRLLPANEPILISVSPTVIGNGSSATVLVTGSNTHFVQGTTVVSVPGFTVGAVTVLSPTTLNVSLTAGSSNTPQPESILVITGTEEAVLPNAISSLPAI